LLLESWPGALQLGSDSAVPDRGMLVV